MSKVKIVRETKIRPGTVQEIIQELLEENLIRIKGVGISKGGRKPILLEINPDLKWTVGLDIDEERMVGGLVNLKGEILQEIEFVGCEFKTQQTLIDTISTSIEDLTGNTGVRKFIIGVGIGIPGLVDREKGIGISCSYYDWWRNIPLKSILENRLSFPFEIVNDTIAATLGEKWYGIGKGINNFLYIDIGETVGMGIVINGQLYNGTGGSAGELGHTIIQKDGPLCICGNEGCVEALASGMALKREAERLRKKGVRSLMFDRISDNRVTLERIIDALMQRDKVAHKLIYDMGTYLGIAISNVVNILNPDLVILGGSLMQAKDFFTEIISQSIKTNCLPKLASEVKVLSSELGKKAGILGASSLITSEIFGFY